MRVLPKLTFVNMLRVSSKASPQQLTVVAIAILLTGSLLPWVHQTAASPAPPKTASSKTIRSIAYRPTNTSAMKAVAIMNVMSLVVKCIFICLFLWLLHGCTHLSANQSNMLAFDIPFLRHQSGGLELAKKYYEKSPPE